MKSAELLEAKQWKLASLGLDHPFFSLNVNTLINTWIILIILLLLTIPAHYFLQKKYGVGKFLITEFITTFLDICQQALDRFNSFAHFCFITALFVFIFVCNIIIVIPWLEEPTKDLNTTLALGLIGFLYIQFYTIKEHGLWAYIKEFFTPFFIMFPLHVIGKIASVISVSFRLFGNIFGGAIITHIYYSALQGSILKESFGLLSGMNHLIMLGFFGLFVGFLQAFVFMMLNITYLSIALQGESEEE